MLPGAVNGKGQKKIVDPATGKTRWITMRNGMVQSPTGVPVKATSVQRPDEGPNGQG